MTGHLLGAGLRRSSSATDPEIADVVLGELDRQRGGLQLIASENFTSPAVLAALGSTLTNKYAEGYPGRRYYGGCAEVDRAEELGHRPGQGAVRRRARQRPAALAGRAPTWPRTPRWSQPGDTVLAMELPHGGHLTHGSQVNFSGKWFHPVGYPVRQDTELIDYDEVRDLARAHRPKLIICGATAYPRLIDFARFREIADEVGAYLMVDAAHFIGLVAGQAIPSPVPYADVVCCHHPQGAARPARRHDPVPGGAGRADRQGGLPVHPGRPADARGRGQGGRAARGGPARVPARTPRQVVANAQALAAGLAAEGMRPVSGGTDTHLALIDLRGAGVTGARGRGPLRRRRGSP